MTEHRAADRGILRDRTQQLKVKQLGHRLRGHHFPGTDQLAVQAVYDQPRAGRPLVFHDLSGPLGAADGNIVRRNDQDRFIHAGIQHVPETALNARGTVHKNKVIPIPKVADDPAEFLWLKGFDPVELGGREKMERRNGLAGKDRLFGKAVLRRLCRKRQHNIQTWYSSVS